MGRNVTLLWILALLLVDLDIGHAQTAASGPRVVAARDVPVAPRQPPKLLLDPPQPERLARLDGIDTVRFSPAGPAIPVSDEMPRIFPVPTNPAVLRVIELSDDWLRALVQGDGVVLAVYVDAAVARIAVVRDTVLRPSPQDLRHAKKPGIPGVWLRAGDVVDVLQNQGKAARVRYIRFNFEATGFLRQQDLGKTYSLDDTGGTHDMCGRETEPDRILQVGAQLRGRPRGPVLLELNQVQAPAEVTILTRRDRHALVCTYNFVGWARVHDLRPYQEGSVAFYGRLAGSTTWPPHPAMPSIKQVRLPERTYFYDRPGGDIIGYASRELDRPIGNAVPGDWVETRLLTSLGEISVWFEVPG